VEHDIVLVTPAILQRVNLQYFHVLISLHNGKVTGSPLFGRSGGPTCSSFLLLFVTYLLFIAAPMIPSIAGRLCP
jgi:hypothetical protein